jgi:hypothetical protein
MGIEVWKPVVGFEQRYEVSDCGRVRSLWRAKVRVLKPRGAQYLHVALYDAPYHAVEFAVHVLVLTTFIGPRPEGLVGMHKDDNTFNNALSNLRWGTSKENQSQCITNGRHRGSRPTFIVPGDVSRIVDLKTEGFSTNAIANWLGLTWPSVMLAIRERGSLGF